MPLMLGGVQAAHCLGAEHTKNEIILKMKYSHFS